VDQVGLVFKVDVHVGSLLRKFRQEPGFNLLVGFDYYARKTLGFDSGRCAYCIEEGFQDEGLDFLLVLHDDHGIVNRVISSACLLKLRANHFENNLRFCPLHRDGKLFVTLLFILVGERQSVGEVLLENFSFGGDGSCGSCREIFWQRTPA
jgi:hypothetical protein